jgi:hypothetical protein
MSVTLDAERSVTLTFEMGTNTVLVSATKRSWEMNVQMSCRRQPKLPATVERSFSLVAVHREVTKMRLTSS